MYKVTIQTLTGSEHTIYYPASRDYTLTSAKLSLQVGSAGEFNFTVPFNNPYYSEIVRNSIVTVYEDGDELWRGDIREINTTFEKSLEVYALEDLAWLGDEAVAMSAITDQTYAQRFQNSISAYNSNQVTKRRFTAGYLTSVTSSNLCTWKPNWEMSLLDCLRDFVAGDGYLKVRRVTSGGSVTRYIDIVDLDDYGKNATQQIQFGYNLMEFVKDMDMSNFLNVLYPFGAETDTVLYDDVMQRLTGTPIQNNTSISTYGRRARTVVFETENLTTLNNLASAYLTRYSQPRLTLKLKAVDLGDIDTTIEKFYLGDYVRVVAKPFGIDQQIYITKQDIDLLVIENNAVEMSDSVHISSLTSQVVDMATEIDRQPSSSSILQAAKQNAINILTGTDGGYLVFGFNASNQIESLAIMNAPTDDTATKKWLWTLGGLGYLHRDQASDPWSTLNVAMTSDGAIVADFITTGQMFADRIRGGILYLGGSAQGAYKNGSIKIYNSSNTEIGSWSSSGLTVKSGTITLGNKTSLTDANSGVYLGSDGIALGASSVFKVTNSGALTATNATLSGSMKIGDKTTLTDAKDGVYIASDGIALGKSSVFKVTSAGALTATNATINGTITVGGNNNTKGAIYVQDGSNNNKVTLNNSGIAIQSGSIKLGSKTSLIDANNGLYLASDGIALGASSKFKVTDTGALTATNATINGNITVGGSDNGKGAIYVQDSSNTNKVTLNNSGIAIESGTIKLGNKTSLTDANTGLYLGSDGIALGASGAFKVDSSGNLNATSATITGGSININSGRFNLTNQGRLHLLTQGTSSEEDYLVIEDPGGHKTYIGGEYIYTTGAAESIKIADLINYYIDHR